MMYYYGSGFGAPHMYGFGSSFLGIIFWVFVIFFAYKLMRNSGRNIDFVGGDRSLEILKERYAKGEINKEQFESMKKDLKD